MPFRVLRAFMSFIIEFKEREREIQKLAIQYYSIDLFRELLLDVA